MKYLFALAFDTWNNLRFAFHEAVDNALDCWGIDDDQEDQW